MTMPSQPSVPAQQLLRSSAVAAAVAAVILGVAVLPAEYGIDPTGIGKMLGLTALHAAPAASQMQTLPQPLTPPSEQGSQVSARGEQRALTIASRQSISYRTDRRDITLLPGQGLEMKALMSKGATLIYAWKTSDGAALEHDFHGEPVPAGPDEFESYIEDKNVSESNGALVAPFTGLHGWYWKNHNSTPVTLVLDASGFYTDMIAK
jgi:hypothetical protein